MASTPTNIILLGTLDTKLEELLYLRAQILLHSTSTPVNVILIDVGRTPSSNPAITVSQHKLLSALPPSHSKLDISTAPRGAIITHLAKSATSYINQHFATSEDGGAPSTIHGIVAAGGSGNTALASQVMREANMPIGLPKFIVSTIASGDISHIVEQSDITMSPSVVDIAGLNEILKGVLDNAAAAIAGMAHAYKHRVSNQMTASKRRLRLGITMFGVTTPCVDTVRSLLAASRPDIEPYVFHATGTGGAAMERLISQGQLDAVLDITTTEVADFIVGGIMSAGSQRLEAALKRGIPAVISVGACDMVNFGPMESVPEKFGAKEAGRNLFVHNNSITLMRTSEDECEQIGQFISKKIKSFAKDPHKVKIVLPRYVSALSYPGQAFEDHQADVVLFKGVEALRDDGVSVESYDNLGINDAEFAQKLIDALTSVLDG